MMTSRSTPGEPAELEALVALVERELARGRLSEAAAAYRQILAIRPDIAEAHNNLGIILAQQGQLDLAAARFHQAIALKPGLPNAHNNLGSVLRRQGKLDEAATCFEQAIALRPDYAEAYYNLGGVLGKQLKSGEAATRFEHAIALRPDYAEAHNNLGLALWHQGQLDQALARFQQAIALRPDYAEAYNNLGAVLWKQVKPSEAATCFEQALALRPNYAEAHNNLGKAQLDLDLVDQAAAHFQQAIALQPDCLDAELSLAACYLLEGDFERGWPAYEARLRVPGALPQLGLPRWTGQSLAGRRLLLLAEQGLGDTFQFLRYARVLKQQGARIVLATQAALCRLLASHPDVDELVLLGSAQDWPCCDFYLPLLAPRRTLRRSLNDTARSSLPVGRSQFDCQVAPGAPWNRGLQDWHRLARLARVFFGSLAFDSVGPFAPLASLPGVRLVSLQQGFGSEQIATVDFPVLDLSGRLDQAAGPFMDTAAVIHSLDLVVTSDTALAHFAGALGAPVWVALRLSPDWRWLRGARTAPGIRRCGCFVKRPRETGRECLSGSPPS